LGDGGIMEKLAAWAEAGADDAMPARREKAFFGFTKAQTRNKRQKSKAQGTSS
jgi:hypothetical protein